jgi:hypothetical protein
MQQVMTCGTKMRLSWGRFQVGSLRLGGFFSSQSNKSVLSTLGSVLVHKGDKGDHTGIDPSLVRVFRHQD